MAFLAVFMVNLFITTKLEVCTPIRADPDYMEETCDEVIYPRNTTSPTCADGLKSSENLESSFNTECIPQSCFLDTNETYIDEFHQILGKNPYLIHITLDFAESTVTNNYTGTYLNASTDIIDPFSFTWARGKRGQALLSYPPRIFTRLSLGTLSPGVEKFKLKVMTDHCLEFTNLCDECKIYLLTDLLFYMTEIFYLDIEHTNTTHQEVVEICHDRVPTKPPVANEFTPYVGFEHVMIYSTDTVCWSKNSLSEDICLDNIDEPRWVSYSTWIVSAFLALLLPVTVAWFSPRYPKVGNKLNKCTNLEVGFLYVLLQWGNDSKNFYPIQVFRCIFIVAPVMILILYPGIIVYNVFDDRDSSEKQIKAFFHAGHIDCRWHITTRMFPLCIAVIMILVFVRHIFQKSEQNGFDFTKLTEFEKNCPLLTFNLFDPEIEHEKLDDLQTSSGTSDSSSTTSKEPNFDLKTATLTFGDSGKISLTIGNHQRDSNTGSPASGDQQHHPETSNSTTAADGERDSNRYTPNKHYVVRQLHNFLDLSQLEQAHVRIANIMRNCINYFKVSNVFIRSCFVFVHVLIVLFYYIVGIVITIVISIPGLNILKRFMFRFFGDICEVFCTFFQTHSKCSTCCVRQGFERISESSEPIIKDLFLSFVALFLSLLKLVALILFFMRYFSFIVLISEMIIHFVIGLVTNTNIVSPFCILGIFLAGFIIRNVAGIYQTYFRLFKLSMSLAKKSDIETKKGVLELKTSNNTKPLSPVIKEALKSQEGEIERLVKKDEDGVNYIHDSLFWFLIDECKPIRLEVGGIFVKIFLATLFVVQMILIVKAIDEIDTLPDVSVTIVTLIAIYVIPHLVENVSSKVMEKHEDIRLKEEIKKAIKKYRIKSLKDRDGVFDWQSKRYTFTWEVIISFLLSASVVASLVLTQLYVDRCSDPGLNALITTIVGIILVLLVYVLYMVYLNTDDVGEIVFLIELSAILVVLGILLIAFSWTSRMYAWRITLGIILSLFSLLALIRVVRKELQFAWSYIDLKKE